MYFVVFTNIRQGRSEAVDMALAGYM